MDRSLLLVSDTELASLLRDLRKAPQVTNPKTGEIATRPKAKEPTPDPKIPLPKLSFKAPAAAPRQASPQPQPEPALTQQATQFGAGTYSQKFHTSRPKATGVGDVRPLSPLLPSPKVVPTTLGPTEKQPEPIAIGPAEKQPRQINENLATLLAPLSEVTDRIERLRASFHGGLNSRIALGLRWIVGGSGALAAFIADSDGLALANHQAPEAYIAVSPDLAAVQDTLNDILPRPVEGAIVVAVDDHNLLQLLLCDTAIGRLAVGMVVTEPLPAAEIKGVRNIVRAATHPTEPHARSA